MSRPASTRDCDLCDEALCGCAKCQWLGVCVSCAAEYLVTACRTRELTPLLLGEARSLLAAHV